jgi:hypothetical protein
MPWSRAVSGESMRTLLPLSRISPASLGVMPNSVCASSLQRPAHEIARFEDRRADRRHRLREEALEPPPDHHLHEFANVGVGDIARADIGAVAQHRDAVGDRKNLIQAVADINDADAALFQAPDHVKQTRHVAFRQRRCRLVHDEDAGVMRQSAQDLDALAVANGEHADNLIGREVVDLERVEQTSGLCPHSAPVDAARPG